MSGFVTGAGPFHLDNRGPEIGRGHRGEWASKHAGEVGYQQPLEGPVIKTPPRTWSNA